MGITTLMFAHTPSYANEHEQMSTKMHDCALDEVCMYVSVHETKKKKQRKRKQIRPNMSA